MRDELFIRGDVPMTKSEVRAVSLSKLELGHEFILYDVGAGTGSVSVEAALSSASGRVFAVEKEEAAISLVRSNAEKFAVNNIEIVCGTAPDALISLPAPTHVFVGGASGRLRDILQCVIEKNPAVRVVVNAVALETISCLAEWLRGEEDSAELSCIQVSRSVKRGRFHLMQGQNPVYVLAFGGKRGKL